MDHKIAFITATRGELKSFSEVLGTAFDMAVRPTPRRPLTISIHGTENTGKSLIAETIALKVAGRPYEFKDFWIHKNKEQYLPITERYEMQFGDIAFPNNRGHRTKLQEVYIKEIISARKKSGILFIHNASYAISGRADIDIRLGTLNKPNELVEYKELNGEKNKIMHPIRWSNLKKHELCKTYNKAVEQHGIDWVRFVEVTYKNTDVLSDEYLDNLKTWDQNTDGKSQPSWLLTQQKDKKWFPSLITKNLAIF